jgi:inner membrane protein
MDTLTHIVIGACIGEISLGKKIGRKAMLVGALSQSLPDIDFLAATWMDTTHNLLAHRGITHGLLFGVLASMIMAAILRRWRVFSSVTYRRWLIFWLLQVLIHIFLDAFNNYGVGWFEPFSSLRISFNTVYVADPFFSIWPGIAFLVLVIIKKGHLKRKWWATMGISLSFIYLVYTCINKLIIDAAVTRALTQQHIPRKQSLTTPTPLNNWLWYVVAGNDSGYYVGYRSVFERGGQIHFEYFPRSESLLNNFSDKGDLKRLMQFSQGFYTVEQWKDTLVFNDLRFGQEAGWLNPRGRFAFHYFLNFPNDNKLVVQRGRFANWNKESIDKLISRAFNKE